MASLKRIVKSLLGRDVLAARQLACSMEFHGSSYGGWYINPDGINSDSIIYSFGTGEDTSFEQSIIEKYSARVFAFDPTPKAVQWMKSGNTPPGICFSELGLASVDGRQRFYEPSIPTNVSFSTSYDSRLHRQSWCECEVRRLATIMQDLHHNHIDILKMDIEGAEYDVIDDILKSQVEISQLLVEFHHRFEGVGVQKTLRAIRILNEHGFLIFKVSSSGNEYSFKKMDSKIKNSLQLR